MLAIALLCSISNLPPTAAPTASASSTHRIHYCATLRPRLKLSCARRQLHEARSQLRHPTTAHSPGYWRWSARVARKEIRSARYRISHPPIRHEQLWVCIHNFEGAWPDATGNGYWGGLQMTENWGPYGHPLVYHANTLSPYGQMSVAEHGWRIVVEAQGYSYARYTWLPGQWYHPSCFQYA